MDYQYFRQREVQERQAAERARPVCARSAHLELADRYRAVADALEAAEARAGAGSPISRQRLAR